MLPEERLDTSRRIFFQKIVHSTSRADISSDELHCWGGGGEKKFDEGGVEEKEWVVVVL